MYNASKPRPGLFLLLFFAMTVFVAPPGTAQGAACPPGVDCDTLQAEPALSGHTENITCPGGRCEGVSIPRPKEFHLVGAHSFKGDLRHLPQTRPVRRELAKRPDPPTFGTKALPLPKASTQQAAPNAAAPLSSAPAPAPLAAAPLPSAPAPATLTNFPGLDFANWGAGHPADANGDVGPNYYIQVINSTIGIFNKSTGALVTAVNFDNFMSQGNFGNLCDTDNYGDPVVLYDTFEDRWIITDFAFTTDASGNVNNPPGSFQCFAVSKTGDPVSGGWNFYSFGGFGALEDYAKFGIWTDGLYMSGNMFNYPVGSSLIGPRVWAINKAQMYAGSPTVQIVSFDAPSSEFTLLPGNARLQAGTPSAGTPNYFVSTWQYLNALTVYKFHVDWDHISLSTFTGPDTPATATSWPNVGVANAPSATSTGAAGNTLDVLQIRAMMQNQYANIGGGESLWATHTVRRANTSGFAAPRWYQVDVTGGTVAANLPQAATWDPDGANVMYRFVPSLAVDRVGNMALGYSTSSSTTQPAIKYAGRMATDAVNTFSQAEQVLYQGAGTQVGTCGGVTCTRWGDYSAMTLDPDGCTFWYTNMYYDVDGLNFLTRIGSFKYAGCTPVGNGGTLQGTVTRAGDGTPIGGATVQLGSRTATTDAGGVYQFTAIPAGTYPGLTASYGGYTAGSATTIVMADSATTTQDFALVAAATSSCFVDTTQADFQAGVATGTDLTNSPGDVSLSNAPSIDQQNTTLGTSGVGITTTTWGGQTFTPSVTGTMPRVDINLFCSGCTGTTPNLTLSLRATSGGLPTGADLATATILGFSYGGAAGFYAANFASPPTLTAGMQYALVIRPTVNPSPGTYALTRSGTSTAGANVYPGGTRVSGATSGTVWSIPLTGGVSTDAGFKVYMQTGYPLTGTLVSGTKDANPATGARVNWQTLSWTASTPAGTSVQFQIAAGNNANGPFDFVGPDGTAGTYFTTSGASLAQFNGYRYLKYEAYLGTTDSTATPVLSDVTVCSVKVVPPSLATAFGAPSIYLNGSTPLTFTITNPAVNSVDLTGVGLTDTLPVGLTVADSTATVCGTGTLTTTAATGLINLTGATVPANSQCQFGVTVTGASIGQYTSTTGAVTSTEGGTGNTASAGITVNVLPAVTSIIIDPATPGLLFAAVDGNGVYVSTDKGGSWNATAGQPANNRVQTLLFRPPARTLLMAATYGGGIFRSSDGGATWTACTGQPASLNVVALASDVNGTLYAGTDGGIFISADCSSWSAVNSGLTVDASKPPLAIIIDPADAARIYAGLDGGGVFRSSNSGGLWTAATTQPTNLRVKSVVLKPGDGAKLYTATYGGGVFMSTNSGLDWSACANTNLANLNVVSLTIGATGKLYAGTEAGVFVSTDNCGTWTAINGGLP